MADSSKDHQALSDAAARQLANTTKTLPQMAGDHAALAGAVCCRGRRSRPASTASTGSRTTSAVEVACSPSDERDLPADLRRLRGARRASTR